MSSKLSTFIKTNRILLILNLVIVSYYAWFMAYFGFGVRIDELVFSASDAREYQDYILFLKGQSGYCNPNRPFFYPLLLMVATTLGGAKGVWLMQAFFWLATCNLSYLSVKKMGGGIFWSSISFLLIGTYFSANILTVYALTEITILFLLSLLVFMFSQSFGKVKKISWGISILAILAILFATKPFFQLSLWVAVVLFMICFFNVIRKRKIVWIWILLALSPAIIQYSINKSYHGVWVSDTLIDHNLRWYLMNKVDFYEATGNLEEFNYLSDSVYKAREAKLAELSIHEVRSYLWEHKSATFTVMVDNFCANVNTANPYLDAAANPNLSMRSWKVNGKFLRLHIYMFIALFIYFAITLWKKPGEFHFYLLCLGFICYMILLSVSITFWAGDRLVVPAIAIWAVMYPVFIARVIRPLVMENAFVKKLALRLRKK
ncbi:MAG TPA: hypothetical protein VD905_21190 [Flavobacteriales bacterium]|nr:hypothetical protein [Flavobacteriales bacterium]